MELRNTIQQSNPDSVLRTMKRRKRRAPVVMARCAQQLMIESVLLVCLWGALLWWCPLFFVKSYLPGLALGIGLCQLQGHYEHVRGTVSHYGWLYNFLFFNDGYH